MCDSQARALTGNQTSDPLVYRLALNPLSYTSQGKTIPIIFVRLAKKYILCVCQFRCAMR